MDQPTANPWAAIWVRPRDTIRQIVSENPNRCLWLLAAIYGFGAILSSAQSAMLGARFNNLAIFLFAAIFSFIWGYVFFSVWSAIVYWTGKFFKGEGTFLNVRSAYAWSCVPLVFNIPIWLLLAAIFKYQLFTSAMRSDGLPDAQVFALFVILAARLVIAVWSLVIYFNALAEVQRYSILKAILNVVLSGLLMGAIFWVLSQLGAYIFYPGSHIFQSEGLSLTLSQAIEGL